MKQEYFLLILDDVVEIELNYDQNNISILGYCALNFVFAKTEPVCYFFGRV